MIRSETPRYDAVFMDHMMPGMDGVEAVRIIREEIGSDYALNVPIIALTANATAGNEELLLANGFQAFISKPIDGVLLDSVLRTWVRSKDRERERGVGRGHGEQGDSAPDSAGKEPFLGGMAIPGVDTSAGFERFGRNEDAYVDVLRSYAANTRPLLACLEECLKSGDLDGYAIMAHGLRGSSLGIGAVAAGEDAQRLEMLAKGGEREKVQDENGDFIKGMAALLDSIDRALEASVPKKSKPVVAAPDPALLNGLREACGGYDVGRVDEIMEQLDSFEYESGAGLIAWLHSQLDDMNYDAIHNSQCTMHN